MTSTTKTISHLSDTFSKLLVDALGNQVPIPLMYQPVKYGDRVYSGEFWDEVLFKRNLLVQLEAIQAAVDEDYAKGLGAYVLIWSDTEPKTILESSRKFWFGVDDE